MKVVLASRNPGKLRELKSLLMPLGFDLTGLAELNIPAPPEDSSTFVENALSKARHASARSGLAAIADDSGIVVAALGGAPGIHSARYAGENATDADNNRKLLSALDAAAVQAAAHGRVPDRSAHYYCVVVFLAHPEDPAPLIATGRWDGEIQRQPRGSNGFGYDPYFLVAGSAQTAAELPEEVKNRQSHRGQAVKVLCEQLSRGVSGTSPGTPPEQAGNG